MRSLRLSRVLLFTLVLKLPTLSASAIAADPPDNKDAARDVGNGISVIAFAATAAPTGVTQAAGIGALVGEGAAFVFMGLWDRFASAPSRPDPSHGLVAAVTPVQFTSVSGSGQAFTDINTSLQFAGLIVDDSRLLDISLTRYFGALNDANSVDAAFQRAAASQFLLQLESAVTNYRSALTRISSDIQSTDFASLSTTVSAMLVYRDQVVAFGFPPAEAFVFSQMNATSAEIALAVQEAGQATGSTVTNADLTGAVIFDRFASGLGQINTRELLPEQFEPIAEPGTLHFLTGGALLLLANSVRRARRNRS